MRKIIYIPTTLEPPDNQGAFGTEQGELTEEEQENEENATKPRINLHF